MHDCNLSLLPSTRGQPRTAQSQPSVRLGLLHYALHDRWVRSHVRAMSKNPVCNLDPANLLHPEVLPNSELPGLSRLRHSRMHHGCYVSIATRPLTDQAEVNMPRSGLSKGLKAKKARTSQSRIRLTRHGVESAVAAARTDAETVEIAATSLNLFHALLENTVPACVGRSNSGRAKVLSLGRRLKAGVRRMRAMRVGPPKPPLRSRQGLRNRSPVLGQLMASTHAGACGKSAGHSWCKYERHATPRLSNQ